MKVDTIETKGGIKRWVCKCGASNSNNQDFCRDCRIMIDSENKTKKQINYYQRMKGRKHAKIKGTEREERANIDSGDVQQTDNERRSE